MVEMLTHENLSPLLHQTFEVEGEGTRVSCELIKADLYPASAGGHGNAPGGRAPFSLVFRGPQDVPFHQGTYLVNHQTFSQPLSMFLVPIGPDGRGLCYEAVFS